MKQEVLNILLKDIIKDLITKGIEKTQTHHFYKYKITCLREKDTNLIFIFVSSIFDKPIKIKKELVKCKTQFLILFESVLQDEVDVKTFDVFDPIVDAIHRNMPPKISLVGYSGVGKTTISKLIRADEIPIKHIPTITGDIATIKIGKLHFSLWDFAGQELFSYLWNNFIRGSDAVLLITDSTLDNVEKSKFFLELIKQEASYAQAAVIANKQDLEGAMSPVDIEKILGLKAYSMIAKDPENRDKMLQIIADILEMSMEISPLLKPLLERDKLTEEAFEALENAEFNKSIELFEKISDLCIDLGDDYLGKEFYEKAQQIKNVMKTAETTAPLISSDKKSQLSQTSDISNIQDSPKALTPAQAPPPIPQSQTTNTLSNKANTIDGKENEPSQKDTAMLYTTQKGTLVNLNLKDFFVKSRSKSVADIPKDKISNMNGSTFSPVKEANNQQVTSSEPHQRIVGLPSGTPPNLRTSIKELKIKKVNLSKMILDYELKKINGEISSADYKEKKKKISEEIKKIKSDLKARKALQRNNTT